MTTAILSDSRTEDQVAALRADLADIVAQGRKVADIILNNPVWVLAMEDAGFILDLATGIPEALDMTRPPFLPLV